MRIVQALHWLRDMMGREEDDGALPRRLRRLLNDAEHGPRLKNDLREGLPTLPAWMQVFLKPLLAEDTSDTVRDGAVRASRAGQIGERQRETPSQ